MSHSHQLYCLHSKEREMFLHVSYLQYIMDHKWSEQVRNQFISHIFYRIGFFLDAVFTNI